MSLVSDKTSTNYYEKTPAFFPSSFSTEKPVLTLTVAGGTVRASGNPAEHPCATAATPVLLPHTSQT